MMGVSPLTLSFLFGSPPAARRRGMTAMWPLMAAVWRGVHPPYNNNREREIGQVRSGKKGTRKERIRKDRSG